MASDWLDLPAPPALPGLYLRAALRRAVTGRTLPNLGLRCQVEVKPEHLARYRQICGFRDDGRLPATYPHVLAFALQMKLLTGQGFPFPLLGLVHLENRIRVMRPLRGLGPFIVSVEVNNLAAHEKGAVFSLITRLQDQLGPLWEGDSRILCRDLKLEGPIIERSEEAALQLLEVDSWQAPRQHRPRLRPRGRRLQPDPSQRGQRQVVRLPACHRPRLVEQGTQPGGAEPTPAGRRLCHGCAFPEASAVTRHAAAARQRAGSPWPVQPHRQRRPAAHGWQLAADLTP